MARGSGSEISARASNEDSTDLVVLAEAGTHLHLRPMAAWLTPPFDLAQGELIEATRRGGSRQEVSPTALRRW